MRARYLFPALSILALTISCATTTPSPSAMHPATAAVTNAASPQPQPPACSPVDFWVFYLDHVGGNYLFRGGMPIVNNQVAYQELVQTKIPAAALAAGQPPPQAPFYIIDVSLVQIPNGGGDLANSEIEFNFWARESNLGQWVYWQTDGVGIDPTCSMLQPAAFRDALVKAVPSWLPDHLDTRVDQLRSWLTNGIGSSMPIVIYIHCQGGCDRTSELAGAYALKYLNTNWVAVNQMNCNGCYGGCQPPGCGNYYEARWYCFWLESQGMNLGCSAAPLPCNNKPVPCNGTPPACPPAVNYVP